MFCCWSGGLAPLLLTSAAKDKLDATITNIMKTSNRGNVTTECILHLKEFSLKFIILKYSVQKLYDIDQRIS